MRQGKSLSPSGAIQLIVSLQNKNPSSYRESSKTFITEAGPEIRVAAEKRYGDFPWWKFPMAYRNNPHFNYYPPSSSNNISLCNNNYNNYYYNPRPPRPESYLRLLNFSNTLEHRTSIKPSDSGLDIIIEGSGCRLETDQLLATFSKIGTPEFLEMCSKSNAVSISEPTIRKEQPQSLNPSFGIGHEFRRTLGEPNSHPTNFICEAPPPPPETVCLGLPCFPHNGRYHNYKPK